MTLTTLPEPRSWQQELRDLISNPAELLQILELTPEQVDLSEAACEDFPLRVPRCFAARMKAGDPHDPLLRQVLASAQETLPQPGYHRDPLQEIGSANPSPGIIHKYHGRVLLMASGSCAINCRYCFRRHFPYAEQRNSRRQWQATLDYVRRDTSIEEVILSGGDPLMLTDSQLTELADQVASIDHVRRLRIHSRLPVVIPQRVTEDLLTAILRPSLQTLVVVHCNHSREIGSDMERAVASLNRQGVPCLNQAVLLAGVNDREQDQIDLWQTLWQIGVGAYYLHVLDPIQGAAHFDVDEASALALMAAVRSRLPGYMVPTLVREQPGAPSKTTL
ncbi:MAG: EF-P beta-lysylation protein EpmB [Pseudomonadota bacterium]